MEPGADVTFAPDVSGTLSHDAGGTTFTLSATGAAGSPLFSFGTGNVSVSATSIRVADTGAPKACHVHKQSDLWMSLSGSLSLTLAGSGGSVAATGCFDLTTKSLALSATVKDLSFSAIGGHVKITNPVVNVSEVKGKYDVTVTAPLVLAMPSGGTADVTVSISSSGSKDFVAGAAVNLSTWLGSTGNDVLVYYASKAQTFATGTSVIGTVKLAKGINFYLALHPSASVISALGYVGIDLPTKSALVAKAVVTFTKSTYKFTVTFSLGSGIELFTAGGTSLSLTSGLLQVSLSKTGPSFGVGVKADLHVPAPTSADTASTVPMTGLLTVGTTGVHFSLSLGTCSGTGVGWPNAFGISGLSVKCAALQGGDTDGVPDIGLAGTVTSLPKKIATVIGYQPGTTISFAFNLAPFLLAFNIGTTKGTSVALKPLQYFGGGTLLKVDYASIYVSPAGATVGSTAYPAGFSMAFNATILHAKVNVLAAVGFTPPSFKFTANVSKITLDVFSMGPVAVTVNVSPSTFEFKLSGSEQFGPGSVDLGLVRVTGQLGAHITLELSSSKVAAYLTGTIGLNVTFYVPTSICYAGTVIPYPCDWTWEGTGFTFHLGRTGFQVTGTGVTLEADGYSVTFDYDGHVDVSSGN